MEYKKTADDYRIMYEGCWLKVDRQEGPVLAKVRSVHKEDNVEFYFETYIKKDGDFSKSNFTLNAEGDKIDYTPIPRGAFNMGKSALFLVAKSKMGSPSKYRRGLCPGNTDIYDPFRKERDLLNSPPIHNFEDPYILEGIRDSQFMTPQKALESVMTFERLGAAFSKDYYFGLKYSTNSIMLFKGRFAIAKVSKEGVVLLKPDVHSLAEDIAEFGLVVKKISS